MNSYLERYVHAFFDDFSPRGFVNDKKKGFQLVIC